MSSNMWARPEQPQPDSAYAGRHVWQVALKPLDNALFVNLTKQAVLSDDSLGSIYVGQGGVLASPEDSARFWRAVYDALVPIKPDALLSCYKVRPARLFSFKEYEYQHEFLVQDKEPVLAHFVGVHDPPAEYIYVSNNRDSHTEAAVRKAARFMEFVQEQHYPYSYMTPLLEDYQLIVWTTLEELYVLARSDYFPKDEIKNRLSEAIRRFGLTLPAFDWIITHR